MSDYTPSVAEMREYVEAGGEPRPWVERDGAEEAREKFRGEAFDRMIEAVRAEEREKADREPSDAEVDAAGEAIWGRGWRVPKEVIRAALLAAQEVRRGD